VQDEHDKPAYLFNYSIFQGNASGNPAYTEVDWLSMYPWAKDGKHPFASVATPKRWSHPVRQYDEPAISVIIPVGPGHEREVINALDSLEMQYFRKWEVIVINDTGNFIDGDTPERIQFHQSMNAYPYARGVTTGGKNGAGIARNLGVRVSRAPLILFLDADDVLADANALDTMLSAWNSHEAIVYSDYLGKAVWDYEAARKEFGTDLLQYHEKSQTAVFRRRAADFDPALAQRQPELSSNPNMPYYHWCLVSVLMPKAWHEAVGGFDESMATWEDVDYHWRLARAGYCFHRISEPLVMYSYHKGYRREAAAVHDADSLQKHKDLIQYIRTKDEYQREPKVCNCGKRQAPVNGGTAKAANGMNDSDFVMIEFHYNGEQTRGTFGQPLLSPTGQTKPDGKSKLDYRGYSRKSGDRFLVHRLDQQARPDMFRLIPNEVVLPEVETRPLPEPKPLKEPEAVKPVRRRRKAKV
jgi:GT2 family glycosyltransferase